MEMNPIRSQIRTLKSPKPNKSKLLNVDVPKRSCQCLFPISNVDSSLQSAVGCFLFTFSCQIARRMVVRVFELRCCFVKKRLRLRSVELKHDVWNSSGKWIVWNYCFWRFLVGNWVDPFYNGNTPNISLTGVQTNVQKKQNLNHKLFKLFF